MGVTGILCYTLRDVVEDLGLVEQYRGYKDKIFQKIYKKVLTNGIKCDIIGIGKKFIVLERFDHR